jgi:RimJ/RimL family protein N-acetyltransferase
LTKGYLISVGRKNGTYSTVDRAHNIFQLNKTRVLCVTYSLVLSTPHRTLYYDMSELPLSDTSPDNWPDTWGRNFVFPLDYDRLKSDRIALTPFIPRIHAPLFIKTMQAAPDCLPYFIDDLSTMPAFLAWLKYYFTHDEGVLFAIMDLESGQFAGILAITKASPWYLTCEFGPCIISPAFRGTHAFTHGIGLIFNYCLELPPLGLGLRRVQWTTDSVHNDKSVDAALRMGAKKEGVMRWAYHITSKTVIDKGHPPRENDPNRGGSTDSTLLAICCDDWEQGGRERVRAEMTRTAKPRALL